MNCEEFEAQLNALLDERVPLAELPLPLREAAANDPSCGRILQAYQSLEASMRARPLPEPPANLASRVLTALASPDAGNTASTDAAELTASGQAMTGGALADHRAAQSIDTVKPVDTAAPGHGGVASNGHRKLLAWSAAAAVLIGLVYLAARPGGRPQDADPNAGTNIVKHGTPESPTGQPPAPRHSVDPRGITPHQELPQPHQQPGQPPATAFTSVSELAQRQYESLAAEARAGLSDVGVLVPPYGLEAIQVAEVPVPEAADETVDRLGPFKESTRGAVGLLMRFTPR